MKPSLLWSAVNEWLKRRLRNWLDVPPPLVVRSLAKTVEDYNARIKDFREQIAEIRSFTQQTIQSLQEQIDILNRIQKPAAPQPTIEPPIQVAPGFRTFTQRRRDYESKWRKPVTSPNVRQIEENSRKIAAGEREAVES